MRKLFVHIARPTKLQTGADIEISQRASGDKVMAQKPAVERRG